MTFHFLRPHFLILLPVALLVWWLWQYRHHPMRAWDGFIAPAILDALIIHPGRHPRWHGIGWLSAWVLAVVALSGPAWRPAPSPFADDPTAAMILLDADQSMALPDIAPNRMTRAQLEIRDLADARKGQPLGLAAYAGSAHLVLPPTRDTAVVAGMAANIDPAIMPKPGKDLNAAMQLADGTLKKSGGAILVITDSVETAELIKPQWPVHFLAIAEPESPEWESVRRAARELGGSAQLMTADESDIGTLVRQMASAPRVVDGADPANRWADEGYWLLIPIVLLFFYHCRSAFTMRLQPR